MFELGDRVFVEAQNYHGEIVGVRDASGGKDYLVRYTVPYGRLPYYETWWPASYLVASTPA